MRPTAYDSDAELYECRVCGVRVTAPDSRSCPECGDELWNLSTSRDL